MENAQLSVLQHGCILESWRERLKILFYFPLCLFVLGEGRASLSAGARSGQKRASVPPGARVTGVCELLNVGEGQSLRGTVYTLNLTTEPSGPFQV